jgi:hypothetical protein
LVVYFVKTTHQLVWSFTSLKRRTSSFGRLLR